LIRILLLNAPLIVDAAQNTDAAAISGVFAKSSSGFMTGSFAKFAKMEAWCG